KLHVPRQSRGVVARPRLNDRISGAEHAALTLVSAPAGFGKTTLLTEWLSTLPRGRPSVAWLSLDEGDNDPALFWTYVVSAFSDAVGGQIGAGALSLLQSSQAPLDAVLATLINDLFALSDDVIFVLDDYHVIEGREVHDAMAFLVEHLPPRIHLVIATRSDPSLPLGRLRSSGDLLEIRAADLRFTPDESTSYLNTALGSVLATRDLVALEERAEGWVVALQLAALSLQGRDDMASFIADVAGTDRYIVDYLAEEVLDRQPEHVRQFLLHTSILDRLSGPLCDSLTGQVDGKVTLAALERANLFLVPLDDRRSWYRYHHLFADVLRAHLRDEQPGNVAGLHRRASDWYHARGEPSEAIRHALAGDDFERAADLAELAIPAIRRTRRESTFRAWVTMLPDEVVRVRPVLNVYFVGALLLTGELHGVEERLRDAQGWLDAPTEKMVVVNEEEFRFLPGVIEMYRAALALIAGDVPRGVAHASRVLEIAPEENHHSRAAAAGLLGLVWWASGDLDRAHQAWAECVAGLRQAGSIADIFGCSIALADIEMVQGRLGAALRTYERALQLVADQGPVLRGTADMYVGMSQIHRERGDLEAARRSLARSKELGEHNGLIQNPYRCRVAMARILEAEGDGDGAGALLDDAQRVYVSDMFPNVRPVPAQRARLHAAAGDLEEALGWVRERGLSVDDELTYLGEFEHITLARILLACHRRHRSQRHLDEADALLARLHGAAESGGRTGSVIEILVLQALAHQARRNIPSALVALRRAINLSEGEGYLRDFADEGESLRPLLQALAKQGIGTNYVRRLLAAAGPTLQDRPATQALIDPLSERELDVLRLLATDLGGPEIARELMVSLNTLRTHTKNVYLKLGVNNRRAAVRQGEELKLLSPRPRR
ncbi:MAG: LuxR C-terminal-related transcriptional regulator, partial [Acidimicrobiales bacterium]